MIGEVHRRAALLAGAEVAGVMASSSGTVPGGRGAWGAETAFADIDEVAASDIDVVHICTPNASHVPYAIRCMEAGKHVLCEKPLGIGLDEAVEAAEVAARTGVVNTMPFAYRFHPMARELRARVQSDEFGAVNLIHGSYLQDWMLSPQATSWRVDPKLGGPSRAFGDIGSHWCDLAEWVTGDRITELVATTAISIPQRPAATAASFSAAGSPPQSSDDPLIDVTTEDTALILFRTENGVVGSTVISQLSAGRKNRLWVEIDGMQHSGVFDQETARTVVDRRRRGGDSAGPRPQPRILRAAPTGRPAGRPRPGLRPVLREFRGRLLRRRRRPA